MRDQDSPRKAYDGVYNRYIKRCIDVLLSSVFIVVALPFYLLIGACIAAEDGFPIFYRPLRGG